MVQMDQMRAAKVRAALTELENVARQYQHLEELEGIRVALELTRTEVDAGVAR